MLDNYKWWWGYVLTCSYWSHILTTGQNLKGYKLYIFRTHRSFFRLDCIGWPPFRLQGRRLLVMTTAPPVTLPRLLSRALSHSPVLCHQHSHKPAIPSTCKISNTKRQRCWSRLYHDKNENHTLPIQWQRKVKKDIPSKTTNSKKYQTSIFSRPLYSMDTGHLDWAIHVLRNLPPMITQCILKLFQYFVRVVCVAQILTILQVLNMAGL